MPDSARHLFPLALFVGAFSLAGCESQPEPEPKPHATASEESDAAKRSIFRPEFQVEPIEGAVVPKPLEMRVGFPEGATLTEQAQADLATVIASPQARDGGAVVLGGHSDAGGNDEANLRVSRARAEAVRDWLVDKGIAEDRITVIAFGEQNPLEPNASPDGTPNEQGRAANRRVEILVRAGPGVEQDKQPTLAETLAEPVAQEKDKP